MKFYTIYLYLILSSILSTVICSTASEDLDACKKACGDFIPRVNALIDNADRTQAEYDALSPYWTTCQYRCYRCHLPLAIHCMGQLPHVMNSPDLRDFERKGLFSNHRRVITYSIEKTCYEKWEEAIEKNDSESTFYY